MKAQQSSESRSQTEHFRALEIHLAVQRHEQLNRLYFLVISGERTAMMDELVGKVFDGMAEHHKGLASLGTDVATPIAAHRDGGFTDAENRMLPDAVAAILNALNLTIGQSRLLNMTEVPHIAKDQKE